MTLVLGSAPTSFDDAMSGATPAYLIRLTTPGADSPPGGIPVTLDGDPASLATLSAANSDPWEWTAHVTVTMPMDVLRLPSEQVAVEISGRGVAQPSVLRLRWHGIDDYMAGRNKLLALP